MSWECDDELPISSGAEGAAVAASRALDCAIGQGLWALLELNAASLVRGLEAFFCYAAHRPSPFE